MIKKFWIVSQEGHGPALWPFKHASEQSAFNEAERLARTTSPGSKFFVLECKGVSVRRDVVTMRFSTEEDIPF